MAWSDKIKQLNEELKGKKVEYNGATHTIAMVDINGLVHIDLPSEHNETTAVFEPYEARRALIEQ